MSTNTYTWKINHLIARRVGEFDRTVSNVNYTVTCQDVTGEFTATYVGECHVPESADVTAGSFLPFDQLTETVCMAWVRNSIDIEQAAKIVSYLDGEVDRIKTLSVPVLIQNLPWDPTTDHLLDQPLSNVDPFPEAALMRRYS